MEKLIERFLKYVEFPTMSDQHSGKSPSTEKQLRLAEYLCRELEAIGIEDVRMDTHGYVYAFLPANTDQPTPAIGLIAHMDTSDAASDTNIKPAVISYQGGDILLNAEQNIVMEVKEYPYLADFVGKRLLVTDGTTLLGADDKAGIAEIVTAIEELMQSGEKHGKVCIAFTPDEEIGEGTAYFDLEGFGAEYAYTVDGGFLGGIECECFNGAAVTLHFNGVSIHPGSAKGKMKSAMLMAMEYQAMLPPQEIPACTEGYEGFYHLCEMSGDVEHATLSYIVRDHDRAKFETRKQFMVDCAKKLCQKHGAGSVEITVKDSYYNMKEVVDRFPYVMERAKDAMRACGVQPYLEPIRGGTDGAALSYRGLPCPNLCTGGGNYHSRFEFAVVEDMLTCKDILKRLLCDAVGANA